MGYRLWAMGSQLDRHDLISHAGFPGAVDQVDVVDGRRGDRSGRNAWSRVLEPKAPSPQPQALFPYFLFGMYSFTALVTDGIDS